MPALTVTALPSPRKVMKGEVASSSKAPPAMGVKLSLQQGSEKLKISSSSSLKHVSFSIYFRGFEPGIAPTASSSWVILGFGVGQLSSRQRNS